MTYRVKSSWFIRQFYPSSLIWKMPEQEPAIYLTFDDGPHPQITPFVLDQLRQHEALGTFFCIGKNVLANPETYRQTLALGHTTGNHTQNHMNGWKTDLETYIGDVSAAAKLVDNHIFRPPYGRISRGQIQMLSQSKPPYKIYMWDVLSGDFDRSINGEQCLKNVTANISPGSIVVFHDSEKAWDRMSYALPRLLDYCRQKNWQLKALPHY